MSQNPPKSIRCSSLDALFACTPAVLGGTGTVSINPGSEAADLGKAVHEMAAEFLSKGEFDLDAVSQRYGFDEAARDDAAGLMLYVAKAWDELEKFFPGVAVERLATSETINSKSGDYQIAGTLDAVSVHGPAKVVFLDWKTGFLDDGYHQQMAGYAYTAWCVMGRPDTVEITGVVVFLRHHYYRVVKWDAQQIKAWEYDLIHNVLDKIDQYRPGKQCRYCQQYATCAARRAVVASTLDTLMFADRGDATPEEQAFWLKAKDLLTALDETNKTDPIVGQVIEDLLFRLRLAKQAIVDVEGLLRQAAERVGGIPMGDNLELGVRSLAIQQVEPKKALPVLRQYLSDEQICKAMRLSLPKLSAEYAASHKQRGAKAAARQALANALDKAGAISVQHQQRLEEYEVRKKPQQESAHAPTGGDDSESGVTAEGAGQRPGAGSPEREVVGVRPSAGGSPAEL
jgi:hypothetical protein